MTAYDLTGHQLSPTVPLTNVEWSGPPGTCCGSPITPAFVADASGITAATSDHRIERLGLDGTVLSAWAAYPPSGSHRGRQWAMPRGTSTLST